MQPLPALSNVKNFHTHASTCEVSFLPFNRYSIGGRFFQRALYLYIEPTAYYPNDNKVRSNLPYQYTAQQPVKLHPAHLQQSFNNSILSALSVTRKHYPARKQQLTGLSCPEDNHGRPCTLISTLPICASTKTTSFSIRNNRRSSEIIWSVPSPGTILSPFGVNFSSTRHFVSWRVPSW